MSAPMPWIRPRYLWQDTDRHGNVRLYVAKPGQRKIRIHADPESEEFAEAYALALEGQALPKSCRPVVVASELGSFRWLAEQYFESSEFLDLDRTTRAARRNVLEACWAEPIEPGSPYLLDKLPAAKMSASHVRMLRDRKRPTPEAANARIKVVRGLYKWALRRDDLVHQFGLSLNPGRDVPALKTRIGGFHTWTLDEVYRYQAHHPVGSTARLALALMMFTGQRRSDVIRFGRQHIRDGWLVFTQHKNRNRNPVDLQLPVLPILRQAIDEGPCGHLTFLVNEYGKPFTDGGFGNRMRKWCDDAGLPDCTAHGLRKVGACIAVENGATQAQLNAIFGWRDPKQSALYTRKARQKKLAGDAMHLLIPVQARS